MRIGLTYDLRSEYLAAGYGEEETAEFDRDDTITAIESALQQLGYATDRVGNARALMARLAAGDRWDMVFNIAEGFYGIGREAQVPAILDVYGIPYTFSDPLVMALTLHKGMTKHLLRDAGIPTSDFAVIHKLKDLEGIVFDPPYFIKPVAEGTGKGVTPKSVVRRRSELAEHCGKLLEEFHQPVLVEPFLPGREFTVGIVGSGADAQILGTMEIHLLDKADPEVYSYSNKEHFEDRVTYKLIRPDEDIVVRKVEQIALNAYRVLGCCDAGRADLRCEAKGAPLFMEINPLAGLHPDHSDLPILCKLLEIPFLRLIDRIVNSARRRIGRETYGKVPLDARRDRP
jgi:D-alanine-D-alanine ligase